MINPYDRFITSAQNSRILIGFVCVLIFLQALNGQVDSLKLLTESTGTHSKKLEFEAFGIVNYHAFNWQLLPDKRNEIDFAQAVIGLDYQISDRWKFTSELEFEHGGTGVALEFDPLEEFGEFEYEVEKGGEIWLEQFNLNYQLLKQHALTFGRVKLPFGLANYFDEPTEFLGVSFNQLENTLLPSNWTEFGILLNGKFHQKLEYAIGMVNALDGSGFNSANFIKRGNQRRFETVKIEDLAGVLRMDYKFKKEQFVGLSFYAGNSRNNRPKPDLNVNALVSLAEFHSYFKFNSISFKTMVLFGHLQNSEQLSLANRNLSNNLNVKRTPVGKQAAGFNVEFAIKPLDWFVKNKCKDFYVFSSYDYFDSHQKTEGSIFNNPRWKRQIWTFGMNYFPTEWLVLKMQFENQRLGISDNKYQRTFSMGFAFNFS
ncbi:MAG TPA: porin [Saprospiraceae bacterium]|nr:porin [Saprospiraceae bacterium]